MINFVNNNFFWAALLINVVFLVLILRFFNRPEWGLYLTFFATGILITPNLPVLREKFTAVEVFMCLTWLVLLLRPKSSRKKPALTKNQNNSLIMGGLFVSWIFLSFVINGTLYSSMLMSSFIETCNFIYGYMMFVTVVLMIRDWDMWKKCLNAWLWGAVVVSFFGILALFGHGPSWTYDSFTHRVCSTLRTENQVPSFLLPIFVVLVFMIVERGRKRMDRWALTALLAGVFLTSIASGSRTSLLMLIVAGVGIVYVTLRESRHGAFKSWRLGRILFFVVFGFLAYIGLALAGYRGDYALGRTPAWKRPVLMFYEWGTGSGDLDENRINQLHVVSENIGDNLVMGTGPKNYGDIYGVEEIHNTFAGVLFQTGVPGFFLFIFWLWIVVKTGWRASQKNQDPHRRLLILCMVMGMVLLLLYSLTMFGLRQRNIWLLAGLLVAADCFAPRRRIQFPGIQVPLSNTPDPTFLTDPSIPTDFSSVKPGDKI